MKKLPSNSDLESIRLLVNNQPIDDFEGLSPSEMNHLLRHTFDAGSPLKINNAITDEQLNRTPFFRLMEEFLKIIEREESIKLTPNGWLQKKVMAELYAYKFITSEAIEKGYSKLNREEDWMAIFMIHALADVGGLIRKAKGKLMLTKSGKLCIKQENRTAFFYELFRMYVEGLSWCNLDTFTEAPVGQVGWGFSVLLLLKYGSEECSPDFYTDKYVKAFPVFLRDMKETAFNSAEDFFRACYKYRSTECFLQWWGVAQVIEKRKEDGTRYERVVATPLLKDLFSLAE